MPMDYALM